MRKRYNTPHRSRAVKTRMTDEEYADFTGHAGLYHMTAVGRIVFLSHGL